MACVIIFGHGLCDYITFERKALPKGYSDLVKCDYTYSVM